MEKYYKQALDIMAQDKNWKKICAEMAKKDPKAFCELVNGPNEFESQVLKIYENQSNLSESKSSGTLKAIDFVRSERNCSIKEARDLVNNILRTRY